MNGKRKVLENSFFYTFSSLLVKAIGFFLLPVYTLFLTPTDYGITNLVTGFNGVATFVVAFSLYKAVMRFYADYKNDKEKLKCFYGTVVVFAFLSSVIFLFLGIVLNRFLISWFFDGISFFPIVLIVLVTLCFSTLHALHQSMLQGMQKGKKLTIINLTVFFLQVGLNLIFIGIFKLGAVGVLLATLIVNIGYFFFMINDLKKNDLIKLCIDLTILREALKYSIPIMPHNLSTHIASFASRVFINKGGSLADVGLYGVASQFGAIIDVIQVSVNKAFAPWFYDVMNRKDEEAKAEILSMSKVLLVLYSLLYLLIGLFSQEVVLLMTNERYAMAWTVIPILVVAFSIKSIYYFYVNILFYHKEAARKIFIATVTGSFFDIVLAAFLVPGFGMYGAAVAFLIAKVIVVSMVVFMARKYNDIGYRLVDMLKTILPSFLFIGFGLFFSYTRYINEFSMFNLIFKLAVLGAYILFTYLINIRIFRGLGKRLLVLRRKPLRGTGKD
jgi:O-antigen/teichoic acid export membrane protein